MLIKVYLTKEAVNKYSGDKEALRSRDVAEISILKFGSREVEVDG